MARTVYGNKRGALTHGPSIEDESPAAGTAPTKAEYDSLVGKFNALLKVCRSANLIA